MRTAANWFKRFLISLKEFNPQLREWLMDKEEPVRNGYQLLLVNVVAFMGYSANNIRGLIAFIFVLTLINYIGFKLSHKADQARMMINYQKQKTGS